MSSAKKRKIGEKAEESKEKRAGQNGRNVLISYIVRAYLPTEKHVDAFCCRAIPCVLAQQKFLTKGESMEIVLVVQIEKWNEKLQTVIEEITKQNIPFRLQWSPEALGCAGSKNAALHLVSAEADFITMLDADDSCAETRLRTQLDFLLRQNRGKIDVCGTYFTDVKYSVASNTFLGGFFEDLDEAGAVATVERDAEEVETHEQIMAALKRRRGEMSDSILLPASLLIPRYVYEMVGFEHDPKKQNSDWDWIERALAKKIRFGNVPDPSLYSYYRDLRLIATKKQRNTGSDIYDVKTKEVVNYIESGRIGAVLPDGALLVVMDEREAREIYRWGEETKVDASFLSISPRGTKMAVATTNEFQVYDTANCSLLHTLSWKLPYMAFFGDESFVHILDRNGDVFLWDLRTNLHRKVLSICSGSVVACTSTRIINFTRLHNAQAYTADGQLTKTLSIGRRPYDQFGVSPCGNFLGVTWRNRTTRVFCVNSGQCVYHKKAHAKSGVFHHFNSTGTALAISEYDGGVTLYDFLSETYELLFALSVAFYRQFDPYVVLFVYDCWHSLRYKCCTEAAERWGYRQKVNFVLGVYRSIRSAR